MSTKADQDALIASVRAGGTQRRTAETEGYPTGWFEEPLFVVTSQYVKLHHRISEEPIWNDDVALARLIRELAAEGEAKRRTQRYISPSVWLPILTAYNHRCVYCGASGLPLERDHRVPVSKGGTDDAANLVPACKPCNIRKSNHDPADWPLVVERVS